MHSEDGKSIWKDNTIQISDKDRVRIQLGKDAAGDYNIYIWDKDGKLMFDPLYGIQEAGIKKAIIRNDMVSDNAAISGKKLDISICTLRHSCYATRILCSYNVNI